uniref:ATP receptor n=1 Tax=Trichobilharzia regenti TaxID=157069 RepID=A0AA85KDU5_TRIRE|nr:unnamed protein product [Trichobilharzia regenti]
MCHFCSNNNDNKTGINCIYEGRYTYYLIQITRITTSLVKKMFVFEMPRVVLIQKPSLAIIHRLIQFFIFTYFVIYVMWLKKGYQSFDRPISGVAVKVNGVAWKHIFKHQNPDANGIIVLDSGDYLLQPTQNSGFYLITTIRHFVVQSMSTCSEGDRLPDAQCQEDEHCPAGYQAGFQAFGYDGIVPDENSIAIDESGHGIFTGKCLKDHGKCEIFGWCPTGDDYEYELRKERNAKKRLIRPPNIIEGYYNFFTDLHFLEVKNRYNDLTPHSVDPLFEVVNFTMLIKNSIEFPAFNTKRQNVLSWMTDSYLQECLYNPEHEVDRYCPIFRLGDVFKFVGTNTNRLLKYGGVVAITISWECDLDWSPEYCLPKYEFLELESVHKVRKLRVDNSTYSHQGGHMKWSPSQSEDTSTSTTTTTDSSDATIDYTYAAHTPKDEDDIIGDEEIVTVHEGSAVRVTSYFGYDSENVKKRRRILVHVNGIQFIIRVTGIAGKFNLLSFTMRLGSGLGLLGLSKIVTDMILFHFTRDRKRYKQITCDNKTLKRLLAIAAQTSLPESRRTQVMHAIYDSQATRQNDIQGGKVIQLNR